MRWSLSELAEWKRERKVGMEPYYHKVQYYETDMMGITHHANYIRWMEEARIDFMNQIGFPYSVMEEQGIISPVKSVSCKYLHTSTFDDQIEITVSVSSFNGVVLGLHYAMLNTKSGEEVCTASSEHVFLDRQGHFVRLKKTMPAFCDKIQNLIEQSSTT